MDVRISVEGDQGDHGDQLRRLNSWLGEEQELRGRVGLEHSSPGASELGPIADAVIVSLSAGGAGTVLASSLVTWIKYRGTTVRLSVRTPRRTVTLEIATVDDVAPLLKQVLEAVADD
jgi:hypothetical protein